MRTFSLNSLRLNACGFITGIKRITSQCRRCSFSPHVRRPRVVPLDEALLFPSGGLRDVGRSEFACRSPKHEGGTDNDAAGEAHVPADRDGIYNCRIVAISDTHNQHHRLTDRIPQCDVLIHSGDFTEDGTAEEARRFFRWLRYIMSLRVARHRVEVGGVESSSSTTVNSSGAKTEHNNTNTNGNRGLDDDSADFSWWIKRAVIIAGNHDQCVLDASLASSSLWEERDKSPVDNAEEFVTNRTMASSSQDNNNNNKSTTYSLDSTRQFWDSFMGTSTEELLGGGSTLSSSPSSRLTLSASFSTTNNNKGGNPKKQQKDAFSDPSRKTTVASSSSSWSPSFVFDDNTSGNITTNTHNPLLRSSSSWCPIRELRSIPRVSYLHHEHVTLTVDLHVPAAVPKCKIGMVADETEAAVTPRKRDGGDKECESTLMKNAKYREGGTPNESPRHGRRSISLSVFGSPFTSAREVKNYLSPSISRSRDNSVFEPEEDISNPWLVSSSSSSCPERRHIPLPSIDILVTHGPPRGVLDVGPRGKHYGCKHMAAALRNGYGYTQNTSKTTRPKLARKTERRQRKKFTLADEMNEDAQVVRFNNEGMCSGELCSSPVISPSPSPKLHIFGHWHSARGVEYVSYKRKAWRNEVETGTCSKVGTRVPNSATATLSTDDRNNDDVLSVNASSCDASLWFVRDPIVIDLPLLVLEE